MLRILESKSGHALRSGARVGWTHRARRQSRAKEKEILSEKVRHAFIVLTT